MGRSVETITVQVRLSRHNSEQDRIDDANWDDLRAAIHALIEQERYADIDPWVV